MIKSFADHDTERLFCGKPSKRLPAALQRTALRKLTQINAATELSFLRVPPGNRLEALKGNRKGEHSIRINDQWLICFRWHKGNVYNVEIVDYHK
jgi:proteic killer suppression protein